MYEIYAAGAVAAFTVDFLIYPLDTIKTRLQSQDFVQTYAASQGNTKNLFKGLYQGIGSVVLATLPAAGIFFATYESMKSTISVALPIVPQPLVHASASALAEMASCVALAPAELIKQNAQMLKKQAASAGTARQKSTSLEALRQLGGPGAGLKLFTGYTALVARNLPFTALQFPIFEHVRERIWKDRRGEAGDKYEQGLLETAVVTGGSAGTAGGFAAWITTPSDVVKTRMMLTAGEQKRENVRKPDAAESGGTSAKRNSWAVTKQVYETAGIKGLFRGGLLRASWTAVGSGLYLGTYESAKVWLTRGKDETEVLNKM